MRPLIEEVPVAGDPELLVEQLRGEREIVLLRSALFDSPQTRYSFVTARPFLVFRSYGSRCELNSATGAQIQFGNPWRLLESLMPRYELLDALDLPFPLGGCFGYWGYDLKNFVEPKLRRRAPNDLELPDCNIGFHDSLVVFDHRLGKSWIISTGLNADGSRSDERANGALAFWRHWMESEPTQTLTRSHDRGTTLSHPMGEGRGEGSVSSNFTRADFLAAVERAQAYIRAGHIYQVNL